MKQRWLDSAMAVVRMLKGGWRSVGLVLTALLVLTPAEVGAQQVLNRFTVAGTVAFGSFWSDESRIGTGPILNGAVRFQPWTHWGMELDLRRYTHKRRFESGVVFSGEGVALAATVAYYLGTSDVQPFISGGVGVLRWERESRFPIHQGQLSGRLSDQPPIVGEEVFRSEDTAVGLSVGGGVKVALGESWSVRSGTHALLGAGAIISSLDVGASMGYGW